jgi:hypothetical protein
MNGAVSLLSLAKSFLSLSSIDIAPIENEELVKEIQKMIRNKS